MKSDDTSTPEVEELLAQDRPHRRWIVIGAIAAVVLAISAAYLSRSGNEAPLKFTTGEVKRGDLTIVVTATGTLEPLNQVDVGSEVSGTIDEVLVDFNDRVKQGQVLARLNPDEQQAKVVQARAALEVAEARVAQAKATVLESNLKMKRCQTLAKRDLCPPQDLDAAVATAERAVADQASAKAQVSQAKATLDAEQTRLAKAVIRSPINGIVLRRQIEPGQTVAASLQAPVLFTLAENLKQMELSVAVDEADIGKVREGQQATFTVDAYGERVFPATLTQVRLAPLSEGGVVSYETILSVANEEMLLRPGMTATAHITVQELHDVMQVPNAALRFTPPVTQAKESGGFMDQLFPRWGRRDRTPREKTNTKSKRVWIVESNQPKAIVVKTGPTDGEMTEILAGELKPGMAVITDATARKQ